MTCTKTCWDSALFPCVRRMGGCEAGAGKSLVMTLDFLGQQKPDTSNMSTCKSSGVLVSESGKSTEWQRYHDCLWSMVLVGQPLRTLGECGALTLSAGWRGDWNSQFPARNIASENQNIFLHFLDSFIVNSVSFLKFSFVANLQLSDRKCTTPQWLVFHSWDWNAWMFYSNNKNLSTIVTE